MKKFLTLESGRKGFTLIELLVVVAIISLLSSIVLASLKDARDKAKGSAFRQSINQFILATQLYRSDNNGYLPESGLINDYSDGIIDNGLWEGVLNNPKYITYVPKPPFTGGVIFYNYPLMPGSPRCDGNGTFVQVYGDNNEKYFEDWSLSIEDPWEPGGRCKVI